MRSLTYYVYPTAGLTVNVGVGDSTDTRVARLLDDSNGSTIVDNIAIPANNVYLNLPPGTFSGGSKFFTLQIQTNGGAWVTSLAMYVNVITTPASTSSSTQVVAPTTAFKGVWAAGSYPAGSIVVSAGATFGTVVDTTQTPVVPISNYSNDFSGTVNFSSPWSYALAAGQDVEIVTGSTLTSTVVSGSLPAKCQRLVGGAANSTGTMTLTLNFPSGGTINFSDAKQSEIWEDNTFTIDGVSKFASSRGSTFGWTARSFTVAPGTHTFVWGFQHDSSGVGAPDSYAIANLTTTGSLIAGSTDWQLLP